MTDASTLQAYDEAAANYAKDWHSQPAPVDLHQRVKQYFRAGLTVDIGCGSGREVAWLNENGFPAVGYDASTGLLREAKERYPDLEFKYAVLPQLDGIADASVDNLLCETVIMHMDKEQIPLAVKRMAAIVKAGGTLYLSWRVSKGKDVRDAAGRLYAAFSNGLVKSELPGFNILLDEELTSVSSGKVIHRLIARKSE